MALGAAYGHSPGPGAALDSHLSPSLAPGPSTVLAQRLHRLGGLLLQAGPTEVLSVLRDQPLWILAIGPLFSALAGIGFKEFFCFQRPEAIGLTLLLPAALLGHLGGLINGPLCLALLESAALLLVLLALRKFGMEAAADVGDKSVVAYLDGQLPAGTP